MHVIALLSDTAQSPARSVYQLLLSAQFTAMEKKGQKRRIRDDSESVSLQLQPARTLALFTSYDTNQRDTSTERHQSSNAAT